jgi:hypothetical protein
VENYGCGCGGGGMNIRVHIERLILDGLNVGPGEGLHVQAAVEAELARLVETGGLAPELLAGINLASVPAGNASLGWEQSGTLLGGQIARSVYEGIGPASGKR